jgi:hypothetical protein
VDAAQQIAVTMGALAGSVLWWTASSARYPSAWVALDDNDAAGRFGGNAMLVGGIGVVLGGAQALSSASYPGASPVGGMICAIIGSALILLLVLIAVILTGNMAENDHSVNAYALNVKYSAVVLIAAFVPWLAELLVWRWSFAPPFPSTLTETWVAALVVLGATAAAWAFFAAVAVYFGPAGRYSATTQTSAAPRRSFLYGYRAQNPFGDIVGERFSQLLDLQLALIMSALVPWLVLCTYFVIRIVVQADGLGADATNLFLGMWTLATFLAGVLIGRCPADPSPPAYYTAL